MQRLPSVQQVAVMTLDTASARYGLDAALCQRVTDRLEGKARPGSRTPAYAIADIEEAILLERDLDICPQCGAPCRPGWRHCERCRICLSCEL